MNAPKKKRISEKTDQKAVKMSVLRENRPNLRVKNSQRDVLRMWQIVESQQFVQKGLHFGRKDDIMTICICVACAFAFAQPAHPQAGTRLTHHINPIYKERFE